MRRRALPVALGCSVLVGFVAVLGACAEAGPPYVTDDPVPTDYRNWEIYAGLQYNNEGSGETATSAPFAEFNYGALPNVQVSISLPMNLYDNDPPQRYGYGYGTTDFGIKTRFVQESDDRPQISFYPSIQIPVANGAHVETFLPLWLQKSSGPWTVFGGGGLYLNAGPGERNYAFAGAAIERAISPATSIGIECYHQGADTTSDTGTTAANVGVMAQIGRYHAILFSFGRGFQADNTFSAYASYEFALGPSERR